MRQDSEFQSKATEALELGQLYLDVSHAHLTWIDPVIGHWEVVETTDPEDGRFPSGLSLDLGETYCQQTIQDDSAVTLHDAPSQGWDDDPAFDCIISDYEMPGQTGIEFLETVRADYPDLPFILYTGKGSEEIASDAITAGVTDYLQKAASTDQYAVLANRVTNAVESYRSQQALAERNRELRRYKDMVNSMHEAACIYDTDGRFVVINEFLADWYNTTQEALEGQQSKLLPSIRKQESTDPIQELLNGNREKFTGELEGEFEGHGYAVLEYQLTPLEVDGTIEGIVGVARDITARKQRERELRRSQRALDEAPLGITITDPSQDDNPTIYANERFKELTGYSADEIYGRNCRFLQGEGTDPAAVAEMRSAIDAEERVTTELRNYRKDGSEFWNRVSITPVHDDDDGNVVNYVGFQQDVTQSHKRRERRASQREALIELATDDAVINGNLETATRRIAETAADVLDVSRVGIWLLDDEVDGKVLTCVEQYDQSTDEDEPICKLVTDEHPAYLDALQTHQVLDVGDVHDDDRVAELVDGYLTAHDIGALLDGTLRSGGDIVGVVCHEHVGGPREWTDDEIDFADDIADIVHRVLRNQEQRERERELKQTNALLSTLFETLPVGVVAEDTSRNILTANDRVCEMFGLDVNPDDIVGRDCEQFAHEISDMFVDATTFVDWVNDVVDRNEAVYNEEWTLVDGRTFTCSHKPIDLIDGAGHLWVCRDITQFKEREAALQRERDRLDEFAGVVSHDLRNPLNVIDGRLELVQKECDSEHLDSIDNAIDRMSAIIEDVLWLAREGKDIRSTEPVDLQQAVDQAWELVVEETGDASLEYADTATSQLTIEADIKRLCQLFENLLANALAHAGPDVTVTVGRLPTGFYIEDDGPGIPSEEREDVFTAGYSTSQDGTGFGLTIVERIVDAHGWEIQVTDGADGGARFEITGFEFA